jgi:hypothetical protein
MTEEECNLIETLASEQSPTCHDVSEAVHGWHCAVRHSDGLAMLIAIGEDGERRAPVFVDGLPLSDPESTADVPLPERTPGRVQKT